jgi:hypothetical protein
MAPVAVPTTGVDELKIDEPKVEKKVDVNEEEDDEEEEGEGGETGATGGTPFDIIMQSILIFQTQRRRRKRRSVCLHQNWICKADQ